MMTRYQLARMAVKSYPSHGLATRATVNRLRHAWMDAIQILGDRWILAQPNFVQKRSQP